MAYEYVDLTASQSDQNSGCQPRQPSPSQGGSSQLASHGSACRLSFIIVLGFILADQSLLPSSFHVHRDLFDLAGEVVIVFGIDFRDGCAFVHANVCRIVIRENIGMGMVDATLCDLLSVDI